jgi:protein disulfide isomerase
MRSSFSLLTLLLFATTTCTTFLLLLNFAPIGFSNAASIRDENADDENENKGQRKRGINVNEDPNVYQYKRGTEEHVEVLTNENFKKFTTSGEHVLVTFYAPWDGHSKSFLKQFHELGTSHTISSDSRLKFGKVDATVEKELAKEFEVETYPQIILFRHGQPKEYKGSLAANGEGLRKWLRRNTHHKPAAWLEGVDDVHVFTLGRPVCIVGFFDDTGHLDNFHAAAYDFHLDFGETSSKIATEKYKTQRPGIIMFRNFDEPAHFQGNVNSLEEIKQFIATNMVPKVVDYAKKDQMERVFEGPIAANVFLFRQQNDEEADKLEAEFAKAADQLYGRVHFISAGFDEQTLYSFFAIRARDTPTVRLYAHDLKYAYKGSLKPDEGKKEVMKTIKDHDGNDIPNPKYEEEMASQTSKVFEDLIKFVDAYEKGKLVPILKSEKPPKSAPSANEATVVVGRTFDEIVTQSNKHVMLFFYAPWCQTSKALMPLWDKLAEMYREYDEVTIAKMDATKNEAKGIHVKSYPTIYFYKSGDKPRHEEFDEKKKDLASFIRFIGERTKLDPTRPPIHDEF